MWRRSCPKCQGDLFKNQEVDGYVVSCLQCGRILRPDEEARLGLTVAAEKAPVAAAGKNGRHHRHRRVA